MNQIDTENWDLEDDRLLSSLIKQIDLEEPSLVFVDNTISTFLIKQEVTFRIVKLPLLLMAVIVLFLLLPVLLIEVSESSISTSLPRIFNFLQDAPNDFSIWYLVYPIIFLLTLILVLEMEMRTITSHRPMA